MTLRTRAQATCRAFWKLVAGELVADDRLRGPSRPASRRAASAPRRRRRESAGCGRWSPRMKASRAFARPASNSPGSLRPSAGGWRATRPWRPWRRAADKQDRQRQHCRSRRMPSPLCALSREPYRVAPPLAIGAAQSFWSESEWVIGSRSSGRRAMSGAKCSTSSPSGNSRSTRSPLWLRARSTGRRDRFRRQRRGAEGQEPRAFRFRRLGHGPVRRRVGSRRRIYAPKAAAAGCTVIDN